MSSKPARRPGELVFALLVLIFGLAAFWQAYEISGFSGLTTPGIFPMLAAGMMVIASLFILADTAQRNAPDVSRGSVPASFLREIMPLRHAIVIGLILLYLIALPLLGFVVSSGLFLLAAFQYLWRKNPLVTAVLAAGSLGAIYLVFRVVFQVVLPRGTWLGGLI
ncbi:tripartite tricarboxylate transporter TctB family protein [Chelativorans salis]|uniref:Tripartite tricarboxylate transporter TctB family protein n=1 Tax=Chelativorans salis TaxID=2978478 RepID=A0ABT2LIG7_9HYPH|nr:tripartite tricarboxylate transporter TctB family protein [Chelativorans sp. EGI FJ00035]MCT7374192.1 tripartite tricarboxylate transporter TctB family protein [Chelativorans sp. EGI FJ00035]